MIYVIIASSKNNPKSKSYHSAWIKKDVPTRYAARLNKVHPDMEYTVETRMNYVQGIAWYLRNQIKLPDSVGWMSVQY